MITKRIQILIQEKTDFGEFNDALYFTEEEYAKIEDKQIESLAQERVDSYVASRQEQKDKPPVEPTDEEKLAYKESLISEKARIETELLSVEAKIVK